MRSLSDAFSEASFSIFRDSHAAVFTAPYSDMLVTGLPTS